MYSTTEFIETLWIGAALIFRQKLIEENEPKRKYSTAMVMLQTPVQNRQCSNITLKALKLFWEIFFSSSRNYRPFGKR